jgi:hypothetical protein
VNARREHCVHAYPACKRAGALWQHSPVATPAMDAATGPVPLVACRGEFVSIQPSWVAHVREANLGLFAHTLDDRGSPD